MRAAPNRGRLAGAALAVLLLSLAVSETSGLAAVPGACAEPRASAGHTARVARVLRSGRDVWGEQLLRSASGPTYGAAASLLPPLLYARAPGKKALTDSGVYYLPFGQPQGVQGAGTVALHVADGSQVIANRVGERSVTVLVGPAGKERYGTCLRRLSPARLADGHLPILETGYVDAAGNRYRQESFAAQDAKAGGLASFIRLEVDARSRAIVRLRPTKGRALVFRVPAGTTTLYAGWLNHPRRARVFAVDQARYDAARAGLVAYWSKRLADGVQVTVPEERVNDATRNLLIQNLTLTYRYSIGNPYEQFSFPEGVDVAQVMAEWGQPGVARSILRTSLTRKATPYPNWKMGEKLVGSALFYRLSGDRAYVRQATREAARLRRGSRPPDHDRSRRPARPRALLVGHPGLGLRAALAGRRLAGPARDGPCLGRDRRTPRLPSAADSSPPGSRTACGGRSACRSDGCRTAPSSCPPS